MVALTVDAILDGCDERQREAITSAAAPLLVTAGAGSGKTRVLTRRIAWRIVRGEVRPERALALTFTRKAAHELRSRLADLGLSSPVPAGTFHSVALAELRRHAFDRGRAMPVVIDAKHRLLDRVAPRSGSGRATSRRSELNRFTSEIEWAKARRIPSEAYELAAAAARRRPLIELGAVASVYAAYETEKRNRGVLDLDDLLERLTVELETDADFAAASRWRLRHLFVDELQDANPAQLALLDAWLGDSVDLFAVGDARQAIYGWNGAEAEAMEHFAVAHPGTTSLTLDANYRSTKEIVAAASAVLDPVSTTTRAMRTGNGVRPSVIGYRDENGEADAVVAAVVHEFAGGREWSQCAVLARTNGQLATIADACARGGVPIRAASARPFLDSPVVKRLLGSIERSHDATRFAQWTDELAKRSNGFGPGRGETPDDESRLLAFALDFTAIESVPTGPSFLNYLKDTADPTGTRDGVPGVDLLSFHRAKGLEWESVWVIGVEDGYVPLVHATTDAQRREEQRLLYVALTRARETLHCSWSVTREMNGRTVNRTRSPFLDPVVRAINAMPPGATDAGRETRLGLEASRAALRRHRQ